MSTNYHLKERHWLHFPRNRCKLESFKLRAMNQNEWLCTERKFYNKVNFIPETIYLYSNYSISIYIIRNNWIAKL